MLRRERGWAFFDQEPDVWEIVDTDQGRLCVPSLIFFALVKHIAEIIHSFLNRVSNASQTEEPSQCFGGIVADPMGLGKTLTMIALAATDLEGADYHMETGQEGISDVPATLIVVPPPCELLSASSHLCI
jgi:SNF2 family DNA or RNA helicase